MTRRYSIVGGYMLDRFCFLNVDNLERGVHAARQSNRRDELS